MFLVVTGTLPEMRALPRAVVLLRVIHVRPLLRVLVNGTAAGVAVITPVIWVLAGIINLVAAIIVPMLVLVILEIS